MKVKSRNPRELAVDLLPRSNCLIRVASVIADNWGIHSWGWNGPGATGMGEHAEAAAIRRSNRDRLKGSVIYVAGEWRDRGKYVMAKPCLACAALIEKWGLRVVYRDKDGIWR